jgi:hypothetical protein
VALDESEMKVYQRDSENAELKAKLATAEKVK